MPATFDNNAAARLPDAAKPTERLVLDGYRHWASTSSDELARGAVQALFRSELGTSHVAPVVEALRQFVKALGRCAHCPSHVTNRPANAIGSDEALVIGMIAALQHGDDRAARACLNALTCAERCQPVAMAAATFAMVLKGYGRTLLPVSESAIHALIARAAQGDGNGQSLH